MEEVVLDSAPQNDTHLYQLADLWLYIEWKNTP